MYYMFVGRILTGFVLQIYAYFLENKGESYY